MPEYAWTPTGETSDLSDFATGHSDLARVDLPQQVKNDWGLSYGTYIRTTLGRQNTTPRLAFTPLEIDRRERANDLKMTSTSQIPLPRRLVRSFGLRGEMHWVDFGNQLVGTPSTYNDASTLLHVVNYFTDKTLPDGVVTHSDDESTPPQIQFVDLQAIARQTAFVTDTHSNSIEKHRTSLRHSIPPDLDLSVTDSDGEDTYLFVLFDDGESFVIGLIPADDESPPSEESTTKKHRILNALLVDVEADPEDVANITDSAESYVATLQSEVRRGDISSSQLDEFRDEELMERYARQLESRNGSDEYSSQFHPLRASPEDLADDYESVNAPREILDYEKDTVRLHTDEQTGGYYYTVPKQVADALWLDDGYVSDWVQVGDVLFSRLKPTDPSQAAERTEARYNAD